MALKISQLLKWKTSVILLDKNSMPITDDNKKPIEVWLRVIGDDDLDAAHRAARIKSAEIRKELRNRDSQQFKDRIAPVLEATKEDCVEVLKTYRSTNLAAEAAAKIMREELPEIDEVALEPDAPTLEEMEKLDNLIYQQEERYQKQIAEYIEARTVVIVAELEEKTLEELQEMVKTEISGIIALNVFYETLSAEKIFRGAFTDKECKIKAFDSIEDYLVTDALIKDQLTDAYTKLEFSPDEIKK